MNNMLDCYSAILHCVENGITNTQLLSILIETRISNLKDVSVCEIALLSEELDDYGLRISNDVLALKTSCIKTIFASQVAHDLFNERFGDEYKLPGEEETGLKESEVKYFREMYKVLLLKDTKILDKYINADDGVLSVVLSCLSTVITINFSKNEFSPVLNSSAVFRVMRDPSMCDVLIYRVIYSENGDCSTVSLLTFINTILRLYADIDNSTADINAMHLGEDEEAKLIAEITALKKKLPKAKYVPQDKHVTSEDAEEEVVASEVNVIESMQIPPKEKIKISSKLNLLILTSGRIHLKHMGSSIRIENIDKVSKEVLRGDYDAIIVLTKFISHCSVERVKSFKSAPMYLASSTNKDKLLVEIYDRMVGVENAL